MSEQIKADILKLRAPITNRYTIDWPSLGVLYGFWATGHFTLEIPERYLRVIRTDGSYTKPPLCKVKVGGRWRKITLKQLHREGGLKLWSWRARALKEARETILAALSEAKGKWDRERHDNIAEGTGGRAIL